MALAELHTGTGPAPAAGTMADLEPGASPPRARRDPWLAALVAVTATVHLLLFAFDRATGFRNLLAGDRSAMRFGALLDFMRARGQLLAEMVRAPVVPGEYLLHWPGYALAGPSGLVLTQIALSLAATAALYRLARQHAGSRPVAFLFAMAFALAPQSLVFQHQFVTEGVACSLAILFVYGLEASYGRGGWPALLGGGLCLGLAIAVRPSMALVLPLISLAAVLGRWLPLHRLLPRLAMLWGVATAPMLAWVLAFAATTGHFGYTSGVASLGWNLRSRVYLVQTRQGLPLAPEVRAYPDYPSLYQNNGGISVGRFLDIARHNPGPFLASMAVDQGIVFGRANTTKLTVDYLGLGDREAIKQWRDVFDRQGTGGLIRWARRNPVTQSIVAIEAIGSIGYFLASGILFAFLAVLVTRYRAITAWLDRDEVRRLHTGVCFVVMVAASANMVDRAQAKLRLPGDVGLVLVLLTAWLVVQRIGAARTRAGQLA